MNHNCLAQAIFRAQPENRGCRLSIRKTYRRQINPQVGREAIRSFWARNSSVSFSLNTASIMDNGVRPEFIFCERLPPFGVQWYGMKEFPDKKSCRQRFE
jgi:hypothetical protein